MGANNLLNPANLLDPLHLFGGGDPSNTDFNDAAARQYQANLTAANASSNLNNWNVQNPFGSQTFTPGANGGRGTLTQSLSPAEQAAYEQRNALRTGQNNVLLSGLPQLADSFKTPFGIDDPTMMGFDPRYAPSAGDIQKDANLGAAGRVQAGLNFSGAPAMPVASDATRQAVSDAMFRQGARYLDPQFQQGQDRLDTMLANQGITRGSTAQDREQGSFDRSKMQAYGDLADRSTQSGIDAMNKLFNEQLAARQQGVGETTTQGQFANSAQAQSAQELLASMTARNAAAQTGANIAGASTTAYNNAQQQKYNQMVTNKMGPLTMYNTLANNTTGQVNTPQFPAPVSTSVAPAPIANAATSEAQQNAANSSASSARTGQIVATAGTVALAIF